MEPPVSILVNDSMRGGYEGAMRLCGIDPFPDCLFCTSDAIARGALKAFYNYENNLPIWYCVLQKTVQSYSGTGHNKSVLYAQPAFAI